jgi:hypothetical protein
MLAVGYFLLLLYLFRDEWRGWIVETYAQAHIEAEKRRMALYEGGFGEPPCCDECEPDECCEEDFEVEIEVSRDTKPYTGRQRFPKP